MVIRVRANIDNMVVEIINVDNIVVEVHSLGMLNINKSRVGMLFNDDKEVHAIDLNYALPYHRRGKVYGFFLSIFGEEPQVQCK